MKIELLTYKLENSKEFHNYYHIQSGPTKSILLDFFLLGDTFYK